MANLKELKVGEEVRIRCVESTGTDCTDCVFNIYGADCGLVKCRSVEREDRKNVHFELMEE